MFCSQKNVVDAIEEVSKTIKEIPIKEDDFRNFFRDIQKIAETIKTIKIDVECIKTQILFDAGRKSR